MGKLLKYFIIVISIISILFSFYAISIGQKLFDSLGGILIGFCLLVAVFLDGKKKKEL
jgi:hypothetical protein